MVRGFSLQHEDIADAAAERLTQARQGLQVYITRGACVQAIDQILGYPGDLGQTPQGQPLAGDNLALACKHCDATFRRYSPHDRTPVLLSQYIGFLSLCQDKYPK
jgi:hypothetical protein